MGAQPIRPSGGGWIAAGDAGFSWPRPIKLRDPSDNYIQIRFHMRGLYVGMMEIGLRR